MRTVAIIAAYNEERFIAACLEHYLQHGVDVYLVDNESTDQTVAIAKRYLGRGLIGLETFARRGFFEWRKLLERKEQLAAELEADWIMHADCDEIRLPPKSSQTLNQALTQVDAEGYNAVNFLEFTFIPTEESPDHDHPDFQKTMRWYYPYLPAFPHRLNAWKKQRDPVELAWSAGHQVRFSGLRMYPQSFPMRHYQFLSTAHATQKYVLKRYDPAAVRRGWHEWRADFEPEMIKLPRQAELRTCRNDDQLDPSSPRTRHHLYDMWRCRRMSMEAKEADESRCCHAKTTDEIRAEMAELQLQANACRNELNRIYASHGWQALVLYYRLRNKLLPVNSTGWVAARALWHLAWKFLRKTRRPR